MSSETVEKTLMKIMASPLASIQAQFVRYGFTTIMIFGCLGNACVVFLFSRNRGNACAMLLSFAAVMNIVYLILSVPLNVYTYEYGDPSLHSMALCKLRYYLFHIWGQVSRYLIAAACIDRFLMTHRSTKMRAFSCSRVAQYMIGIINIFWYIFAIHILIMTTIKSGRCGYFDLYSTLNSIYVLVFVCFIPPLIMAIFGYLAWQNFRRMHVRIQPVAMGIHRHDRNYLAMLLAEVCVYLITMSLYPAIIFEVAITNSITPNKTLEQVYIENFILFIAQFFIYLNTSAPFYIYFLASEAFRNDFKYMMKTWWRRIVQQ